MSLIIQGKSTCPLCGEVLEQGQELFAKSAFIEDRNHPLWRYLDAAMHQTCFLQWPERAAFISEFNGLFERHYRGIRFPHPDGTIEEREQFLAPRRPTRRCSRPLRSAAAERQTVRRTNGARMRKQYHFRPSPAGLRAWDVDRLVLLSKDLVPEPVPIADIRELDEAYWGESMTCREVAEHARLIQEADLSFPVILSSDGRIMDGMHRVLKATMEGRSHVPAVRFRSDPTPDYIGVDPESLPYEEDNRLIPNERDA
jgi:hypothetical protein